ncbi:MAG: hypothetical protein GY841_08980 [FCB group bacterium]|nr:hypothetical protein [FCB group bacterium]
MEIQLTDETKRVIQSTEGLLKGAARRVYMASVVAQMGRGGQRRAAKELGWNRDVIRKGQHELQSGIICVDAFSSRGRKRLEDHLPNLDKDIREIAEAASQTDPTFRTTQLYRRLTAGELRRQLLVERGYLPGQVPSERTLRRKLTEKGFPPRKVAKSKPIRKIKETDAIFNEVHRVNKHADADPEAVRVSIDTKAVVAIGDLSRGGKSRQGENAADHDFEPDQKLRPFGIFRPDTNQTWLFFTSGSVTADFMIDRLEDIWPELKKTVILHIPW